MAIEQIFRSRASWYQGNVKRKISVSEHYRSSHFPLGKVDYTICNCIGGKDILRVMASGNWELLVKQATRRGWVPSA
jgi:hypothetical protein